MESTELLQIGEFAKAAGTTLRTVRYYEELDLIKPTVRSTGGFRFYNRHQLERVLAIKKLQNMGLSLAEIRDVMNVRSQCQSARMADLMVKALDRQRAAIQQKIAELETHLQQVTVAADRLKQCAACEVELGLHCDPCQKDGIVMPAALKALL